MVTAHASRPRSSSGPVGAQAFTLIELLVVIAIIAVLAAIAVPVISGMSARGADAADVGHLRQIGTAIGQFAADNNNRWPNAKVPVPGDKSNRGSFMESVERALGPGEDFNPGSIYNWRMRPLWFSKAYAKMPEGKSIPKGQYYYGLAWGMNPFLYYNRGSANMNQFNGHILRVPNLAKLVLVGEKNRDGGHDFRPYKTPSFERDVDTEYRISRNGKAYYLFGDYHIESIEGDQSLSAHPEYGSYDPDGRLYYKW